MLKYDYEVNEAWHLLGCLHWGYDPFGGTFQCKSSPHWLIGYTEMFTFRLITFLVCVCMDMSGFREGTAVTM